MGKYFLELGANLVITSRKKEVLDKTAAELSSETGGKVLAVACDVRKYEEIDNVIKSAEKEFGQIHGVLNNAAGNFISPTERLSHRAFDIVVDIVLKGTYYTTLAAGKNWIAKKTTGTIFKYCNNVCMYRLRLCSAVCLRQSRCTGINQISCTRMG